MRLISRMYMSLIASETFDDCMGLMLWVSEGTREPNVFAMSMKSQTNKKTTQKYDKNTCMWLVYIFFSSFYNRWCRRRLHHLYSHLNNNKWMKITMNLMIKKNYIVFCFWNVFFFYFAKRATIKFYLILW